MAFLLVWSVGLAEKGGERGVEKLRKLILTILMDNIKY